MGETKACDQEDRENQLVRETMLAAGVFDAFASALLNEPSDELVRETVSLLVPDASRYACSADELCRQYRERFVVASSKSYVPLRESVVRTARAEAGSWAYGPVSGGAVVHVVRCYESAGFSARSVRGRAPLAQHVQPDHLAVEVSFLSYLNRRIATAKGADDRAGWCSFASSFADEHAAKTAEAAAVIARNLGGDVYAALLSSCAAFAGSWVAAIRSRLL